MRVHTTAGAALACAAALLLAGCAASAHFHPVADPAQRVRGDGFSVLPPDGTQWAISEPSSGSVIAFGKADPAIFREGGSVIAVAARERARRADIATPEGLRDEVEAYVRRNSPGHRNVTVALQPYRDTALGTDCVRIEAGSEEHGNPRYPGQVLLLTLAGKACRMPAAPTSFVQVTYSGRRPFGVADPLTDALRRECGRMVESLAFGAGPRE